jgi:hypothetical protein
MSAPFGEKGDVLPFRGGCTPVLFSPLHVARNIRMLQAKRVQLELELIATCVELVDGVACHVRVFSVLDCWSRHIQRVIRRSQEDATQSDECFPVGLVGDRR